MELLEKAISYIEGIARIPSFSTYEDRAHSYINKVFEDIQYAEQISVPGNNLVYRIPGKAHHGQTVAFASHIDKINHYGKDFPEELPFRQVDGQLEGAMDDSAGIGILLALSGIFSNNRSERPDLLFFFSEMEESKGLREHPELLKNHGQNYTHGMGARRISRACIEQELIPEIIITVDTTPLFKGEPGVALYAKHWELTELDPSEALIARTEEMIKLFKELDPEIHHANNTNDYLHYGYEFNKKSEQPVVSLALEPAIYPYHQKEERVFIKDIDRTLHLLTSFGRAIIS